MKAILIAVFMFNGQLVAETVVDVPVARQDCLGGIQMIKSHGNKFPLQTKSGQVVSVSVNALHCAPFLVMEQ